GGAGGNGGAAERSIVERDFGFEGGIAAGIEDFAGVDPGDAGHGGENVRWVESAVSLTERGGACRGFLTGFRDLRVVRLPGKASPMRPGERLAGARERARADTGRLRYGGCCRECPPAPAGGRCLLLDFATTAPATPLRTWSEFRRHVQSPTPAGEG